MHSLGPFVRADVSDISGDPDLSLGWETIAVLIFDDREWID